MKKNIIFIFLLLMIAGLGFYLLKGKGVSHNITSTPVHVNTSQEKSTMNQHSDQVNSVSKVEPSMEKNAKQLDNHEPVNTSTSTVKILKNNQATLEKTKENNEVLKESPAEVLEDKPENKEKEEIANDRFIPKDQRVPGHFGTPPPPIMNMPGMGADSDKKAEGKAPPGPSTSLSPSF